MRKSTGVLGYAKKLLLKILSRLRRGTRKIQRIFKKHTELEAEFRRRFGGGSIKEKLQGVWNANNVSRKMATVLRRALGEEERARIQKKEREVYKRGSLLRTLTRRKGEWGELTRIFSDIEFKSFNLLASEPPQGISRVEWIAKQQGKIEAIREIRKTIMYLILKAEEYAKK